jgi:hypothetical protein
VAATGAGAASLSVVAARAIALAMSGGGVLVVSAASSRLANVNATGGGSGIVNNQRWAVIGVTGGGIVVLGPIPLPEIQQPIRIVSIDGGDVATVASMIAASLEVATATVSASVADTSILAAMTMDDPVQIGVTDD